MSEITDVLSLLKKTAEALGSLDHQINSKRIDAQIYEKQLNKALEGLDRAKEEREALKADIEALAQVYRERQAELAPKIASMGLDASAKLAEADKLKKQAEADSSAASDLKAKYEDLLDDLAKQKERILSAVK